MEYDSVIGNNEAALTEKNISKIHCVAEIIKVEKSVNSGLQFEYKTYTYKHIPENDTRETQWWLPLQRQLSAQRASARGEAGQRTPEDVLHTALNRPKAQLQPTSPWYYSHQSFILICVYHQQHAPFQEATELIFEK